MLNCSGNFFMESVFQMNCKTNEDSKILALLSIFLYQLITLGKSSEVSDVQFYRLLMLSYTK